MKHVFIINPVAGKGKTMKLIPEIHELFRSSGMDYIIEITKYPGHATELAAQYSTGEACRIYSVGGDGTLNEVLNGMAGSGCTLAMLPCGSGNDFIKSISDKKDFSNILKETVQGEEREIDLAKVNGRYFVNISSLGFDALVAYNTNKFKKIPLIAGSIAYILSIFLSIIWYEAYDLKIKIDDDLLIMKSTLIAVANGRYYGGGMMAAPEACLDDGIFDICLVTEMKRLNILRLFPKFIKGQHGELESVSFRRGKMVGIESSRPIALNVDGEVTMVSRADFEIIPKGVKIIVPA